MEAASDDEKDENKNAPPELHVSDQPFSLAFHPQNAEVLAVGLIDGTIEFHGFHQQRDAGGKPLLRFVPNCSGQKQRGIDAAANPSCRMIDFMPTGKLREGGGGGEVTCRHHRTAPSLAG